MKSLMIVAALAGAVVTTSAFAQTTAPAQNTYPANTTTVAMNNTATSFQQGSWVAPDGVQTAPRRVHRSITSSCRRSRTASSRT